MNQTPIKQDARPDIAWQWGVDTDELETIQLRRLNRLLADAGQNAFYRDRLGPLKLPLESLDQLDELPLLVKSDLVADSPGQPGRLFTLPRQSYCRFHQTSGTSGHPMPVLDTAADWCWWLDCWQHVLHAAHVTPADVAMMAFSFGPFIGFWTASDALVRSGALMVPGGGMSSETRLQMIHDHRCTLVCCTPTYALHLLAVADQMSINLRDSTVTRLIVAGEPGGSQPAIRARIEQGWGATVIDHSGASEIGAWGFGSDDGRGLHVIETEFIAERLCFDDSHPTGRRAGDGEPAELVLTGLGRYGGPAIRYRTGDIVQGYRNHDHRCRFLYLDGGVLGRSDDMMVIRGVNVFPSSIESIVRQHDATAEFRMIVTKQGEMDTLAVEAELDPNRCAELAELFHTRLAMRVDVQPVEIGSLPRFQAKSKRLVDRRSD
ncbi:phenylacetate--CoA ligase family protein [Stieleria sp. TO1_6]|uniref:phenylacetate--CoA ligase family protein n=1 Tax=Stieleria tagensis TaxID=2956795 RepID=UPI00209B4D71|nr:AMP-binding protein [Stieleria tagensis]MCO8121839.1 phenylacetate--CoA ligase family protein [Stieleria tagensis]